MSLYCKYPWLENFITVSGDVKFCCFMGKSLGNLKDNSFMEIYNSALAVDVRDAIKHGMIHPACNSVSCPHYNKNLKVFRKDILNTELILKETLDFPEVFYKIYTYACGDMGCEHVWEVVQSNILNAYAGIQAFNLDYSERLYRCDRCGKKELQFRFRWHDIQSPYIFSGDCIESNNVEVDFYFPLYHCGQGDILSLSRFLAAIPQKSVGLITMESYSLLKPYFNKLSYSKNVIIENPPMDRFNECFGRFSDAINKHGYINKMYPIDINITYEDFLLNFPRLVLPPKQEYSIIIHRRKSITRKISRNFNDVFFSEVLVELRKKYSVGVVGLYEEDPVDYGDDLRKLPFSEQISYIAGAKVIIDTDSLIDKIAEWCRIPSIIVQVEEYVSWGAHLYPNGDVVIGVKDINDVTIEDIVNSVDKILSRNL